eukprot:1534824-Prymnesium_polylepis.1
MLRTISNRESLRITCAVFHARPDPRPRGRAVPRAAGAPARRLARPDPETATPTGGPGPARAVRSGRRVGARSSHSRTSTSELAARSSQSQTTRRLHSRRERARRGPTRGEARRERNRVDVRLYGVDGTGRPKLRRPHPAPVPPCEA